MPKLASKNLVRKKLPRLYKRLDEPETKLYRAAKMDDAKDNAARQNPLEKMLVTLHASKTAIIRERIASIWKKYETATKVVATAYDDFSPEHVPIDLNRVLRDLRIGRDHEVDEETARLEAHFKVATSVLREVASKAPEFYEQADAKLGKRIKQYGVSDPVLAASVGTHLIPLHVIQRLTNSKLRDVLKIVRSSGDAGISFHQLCEKVGFSRSVPNGKKDTFGHKRTALAKFMLFLRENGYVSAKGQRRGMTYQCKPSIDVLVKMLEQP